MNTRSYMPAPMQYALRRRLALSALFTVAVALLVGLLPGPSAVTAFTTGAATAAEPNWEGCTVSADRKLVCPIARDQAGLFNPAVIGFAPPERQEVMKRLEAKAWENVLANYRLPAGDLPLARSYARAEAQAEMWAMVVQALETPQHQRDHDQQVIVRWLADMVRPERTDGPIAAAREYAKFAGKNVQDFDNMFMFGNPSEDEIRDFLSGPAEPYNTPDKNWATGGYCRYTPPAPYQDEYQDGRVAQTCFTACQNIFGCAPPTPTYEQFVKWGQAAISDKVLGSPQLAHQAASIAAATVFASAAAEAISIGVGIALKTVLDSTVIANALVPFAGAAVEMGSAAGLPALSGAAIGFMVGVIIAVVLTSVMVGIQVANIEQLPGKLAAAIAQAREVNVDEMFASEEGAAFLYALFVSATLPLPDPFTVCDNIVLAEIYRKWANNEPVIGTTRVPWSELRMDGCLNAAPVPPASQTDPHFVVTHHDSGGGAQSEESTITAVLASADRQTTARVSGNWFVAPAADNGTATDTQSLRLSFSDWEGRSSMAWLKKVPGGYRFFGLTHPAEGELRVQPGSCEDCWETDTLRYVGPDGDRRSARLVDTPPPPPPPPPTPTTPLSTGSPTFSVGSADRAYTAAPVHFDAADFRPTNAVEPVTFQWRFQKAGCGIACQEFDTSSFPPVAVPSYGPPVDGATATYAWQTSGRYHAQVTATDATGKQAQTALVVDVATIPPTVTLSTDCALMAIKVHCNNYPTAAGQPIKLFGGIHHAGTLDSVIVHVDWGDGTSTVQTAGPNTVRFDEPSLELSVSDDHTFMLVGTHTYAKPGQYLARVTVRNNSGATGSDFTQHEISGPQTITFGEIPDKAYGVEFTPNATGSDSGIPVIFTAGPDEVCTAAPSGGTRVVTRGVGECTVTANQAGSGRIYQAAQPVSRTFQVRPAQIHVAADNKTKTYGSPNPEFTFHAQGLRNGDTLADLGDLVVDGPPADSAVGSYDLVPSGGANPNYEIDYVKGRLEVHKAALTVTADDQTRTYGDLPARTMTFDGLVNGDKAEDITGVRLEGPPRNARVGEYPIQVHYDQHPNYEIRPVNGKETITPAPLTVTANDVTRSYGSSPVYTARYEGLVNGDQGLPLSFAGAPDSADVGTYPIVPSADSQNYDITFVSGTDTVTPAPLNIRALDKTRVYGAASPAYTTVFDGLENDDTRNDITGLVVAGAPAKSGVGTYPIVPSGATNPNYEITFTNGTETVTRAPLTITADDMSKVYGAPDPVFTATYDGLVNGDTEDAVTGLEFEAAPTGSDVGTYPIKPKNASSADYSISYVDGEESITPAPLTIRADDKTVKYGTVAAYTWRGQGWVNGDGDASIGTAPSCRATIQGAAASVTTPPGAYLGAITCSGAADPNYTVGYASGKLTVNPVITLSQTGLPGSVPARATLDGVTVTLPTGEVEVGFGTAHGFSFPAVVTDAQGVAYVTTAPAFSGPVSANLTVTAAYSSMSDTLSAAVLSGGLDSKLANSLTKTWDTVQAGLKVGNLNKARSALKDFASAVRAQSGKKIRKATADALVAQAQAVYTSIGGIGTV